MGVRFARTRIPVMCKHCVGHVGGAVNSMAAGDQTGVPALLFGAPSGWLASLVGCGHQIVVGSDGSVMGAAQRAPKGAISR